MEDLSYYPQLAARIGELSDAGMTPETIVIRLRDEGFRHSRDDRDIGWRAVEQVLLRTGHAITRRHRPRRVHPDQAPHNHEWWLADLAAELGVTIGTIHSEGSPPMNGSALHQTAADCAEELPGAESEHPFSPGWAERPVDPHTYGTGTRAAR